MAAKMSQARLHEVHLGCDYQDLRVVTLHMPQQPLLQVIGPLHRKVSDFAFVVHC